MKKRVAHTVDIIKRLFEEAEQADRLDVMQLLGLYDEVSRLERKWRMQFAEKSERRKPEDIEKLNAWSDRLQLLLERGLRQQPGEAALTDLLKRTKQRTRSW